MINKNYELCFAQNQKDSSLTTYELWSLQEKRVYTLANTIVSIHKGIAIVCTPKGEPLVIKKR